MENFTQYSLNTNIEMTLFKRIWWDTLPVLCIINPLKCIQSLKFPDQHASYPKSRINNAQHWFVEWASNIDGNNLFGLCGNSCRLDRFTIFVGNLCEDISQDDLYEEFGSCGKIANVHVIHKPNYRYRTRKVFAFIKYNHEREAAEAIDQKVHWEHSWYIAYSCLIQYMFIEWFNSQRQDYSRML